MKRVIYVDYENVSIGGLAAIEKLGSDDCVKIFIGAQSSKLSMVDADRIFNSEAQVELITNKYIGKNALDFIIMVHLGYDIAHEVGKEYYIVSKDKGYDPAIQEMRKVSGKTVARRPDINEVVGQKKSVLKRALGLVGIGREKEEKDTTEHHVIKDKTGKKKTLEPDMIQTEAELEAKRSLGSNNHRRNNRNNTKNVAKADKLNDNKKVEKPRPERKPRNAKKTVLEEANKTEAQKPDESNKPEVKVDTKANEAISSASENGTLDRKPRKRRTRRRKTSPASAEEAKVLEVAEASFDNENKANEAQVTSDDTNTQQSGSENASRKRRSRNRRRPNKRGEVTTNTGAEAVENAPEKDVSQVEHPEQNVESNEGIKSTNNRRRTNRRRGGRRPNGEAAAIPAEGSVAKEAAKSVRELTPEEEARQRERAAAFALLAELNNE